MVCNQEQVIIWQLGKNEMKSTDINDKKTSNIFGQYLSKSDTVPSLVYTESFTPKWPKGR